MNELRYDFKTKTPLISDEEEGTAVFAEEQTHEDLGEHSPSVGEPEIEPEASAADQLEEASAERVAGIIESILFVSADPISASQLFEILNGAERSLVQDALEILRERYQGEHCGIRFREIAGGFQLRTKEGNAPWIKRTIKVRPLRLSPASLEVLALIAYRQPMTRAQIEHVRGVDCGGVIHTLLERDLIRTLGKLDEAGRPTIYGTTKYFLEAFGLKSLTDLPTLKEVQELSPEESAHLNLMRTQIDGDGAPDQEVIATQEADFLGLDQSEDL